MREIRPRPFEFCSKVVQLHRPLLELEASITRAMLTFSPPSSTVEFLDLETDPVGVEVSAFCTGMGAISRRDFW